MKKSMMLLVVLAILASLGACAGANRSYFRECSLDRPLDETLVVNRTIDSPIALNFNTK